MPNPDHNYEAVLEHVTWVQRLAYRLCADAAQAEDVSQESLLSAFREPRRQGSALRHWLVGVVRNQARMARRRAQRRDRAETRANPPEAPPSAADLVERIATQRTVVTAVMELPEIYRTALLRRYFDDLGPGEIAAAEGVPEATIKTRLRRGLEALRTQLADDFGGDADDDLHAKGALAALLPIAQIELRRRRAQGVSGATTGAPRAARAKVAARTPFGSAATWLLASCTAVWLGYLWFASPANESQPPSAAANAVANLSASAQTHREDPERESASGVPAIAPIANSDDKAIPDDTQLVRVTVFDVDGRPCADVELATTGFESSSAQAPRIIGSTDASGACAFEHHAQLCQLICRSDRFTTVIPATVFPYGSSADVTVVIARTRRVTGVATSATGVPIEGARITYRTTANIGAQLDFPIDRATRHEWHATSDERGAFAFADVPELPQAGLWLQAWDCESTHITIAARGDVEATCTLAKRSAKTTWIQGLLLQPNGQPATFALVSLGSYAAKSDESGHFRIDAGRDPKATRLWAATIGSAPISIDRPATGWPTELELQFVEPLMTISGRVVDPAGEPQVGVLVDLAAPTMFAFLPIEDDWAYRQATVEEVCLGHRTCVRTDANGAFQLHGLANRNYRIVLSNPRTLDIASIGPLPAGTAQHQLILATSEPRVRVAGRVVNEQGEAMRAVPVHLRQSAAGGATVSTGSVTDETGRFAFDRPMPQKARMHISAGGSYTAISRSLDSFEDPSQLTLVLHPAGGFFLQLTQANAAPIDSFTLEDNNDTPIPLQRVEGQACFTIARGSFNGRRSPVYRAPIGQHMLVLWRDGRQVRRLVVDIRAGQPTCIQL